jgi:stearoyl-CoA desaturase (delta-9 desaturase)
MNTEGPVTRVGLKWTNLVFLVTMHLLAVLAMIYLVIVGCSAWSIALGVLWMALSGMSVAAGYHRLFAHGTYRASSMLRAFYVVFGAAAVQNTVLAWVADHRAHHAHTDQDDDPYNIKRGFWWAHVGWVITKSTKCNRHRVTHLMSDPIVRFRRRYYVPLAAAVSLGIPAALGALWGDPLGAMLIAGVVRLVVQWHETFFINSLAHFVGRRPYDRSTSARDSFWVAVLTFGEGYHNFHHRFQSDYRTGVHWYDADPAKWWIWTMSKIGLARDLKRISRDHIRAARVARGERSTASGTRAGG